MEKSTIDTIRNGLLKHRGAVAEVVRRTKRLKEGGYSRSQVDYVLRGRSKNPAIISIASEVLADRDKQHREIESSITHNLFQLENATATA